jgi:DNA processing protein
VPDDLKRMPDDSPKPGALDLLAIMATPGIGPAKALIIAADPERLSEAKGLPEVEQASEHYEDLIDRAMDVGIRVYGFFDEGFPLRLQGIPSRPAVLWVRGELPPVKVRGVAVVGTRTPSVESKEATRQAVLQLPPDEWVVVSGLAAGIDTVAHEAALDAGILTTAVLGSGVDSPSPTENLDLADRILAAGGCLVSEQPPSELVSPASLVQRNRLQAGLSEAVIVGEMGIEGGTAHTVRYAVEQGREVLCLVDSHGDGFGDGSRELLTSRPPLLCDKLPAWRGREKLARGINTPTVAGAVAPTELLVEAITARSSAGGPVRPAQLGFDV